MNTLGGQLLNFVQGLRKAEVSVSMAEALDAMRAVAAVGITDRARMREALAAALVKDEADRESFEKVFDAFFRSATRTAHRGGRPGMHERSASAQGGRGQSEASSDARTEPALEDVPPTGGAYRKSPQSKAAPLHETARSSAVPEKAFGTAEKTENFSEQRTGKLESRSVQAVIGEEADRDAKAGEDSRRAENEAASVDALRETTLRRMLRMPFAAYTSLEYDAARETLAPLARRFRLRLGRRLRPAHRGRVDFRRTIRASLQHGGALVDLRFRARRPRHLDLLILADVSGSVRYCTALMLELVAGIDGYFRRVRSFVFVDHLNEADFAHGHVVTDPSLDLYARSDFGRVLGEVWERRAELLSRTTLMVILGDGRNNRRPARADFLHDLRPLCRAIVWLNPEAKERWGTGDSAIYRYALEVDTLYSCSNLSELERSLERSVRAVY